MWTGLVWLRIGIGGELFVFVSPHVITSESLRMMDGLSNEAGHRGQPSNSFLGRIFV
jgi:hypothetical protein